MLKNVKKKVIFYNSSVSKFAFGLRWNKEEGRKTLKCNSGGVSFC